MRRPERRRISQRIWAVDWSGWLALIWAVWFGVLYANMMIEARGGKVRAWLAPLSITRPR